VTRSLCLVLKYLLNFSLLLLLGAANAKTSSSQEVSKKQEAIQQAIAKLPLAFEANQGQADSAVKFLARASDYTLFLTANEAVLLLDSKKRKVSDEPAQEDHAVVVRMRFEGANQASSVKGEDALGFKTNYFNGSDSVTTFTDISNHGRVKYTSIYPGVDLLYYGNQQQLEYDLLVAPKADPKQIKIRFSGAGKVALSNEGNLILHTAAGDVSHHKPIAYQIIEGKRNRIDANYQLAENGEVGFRLGEYDTRHALVIDPIVSYSSFLWGNASSIAVDAAGNSYIVGTTMQADLPVVNGYQTKLLGKTDAYIAKLDPTGAKLVYLTYLGARNSYTSGKTIAIDAAGNAYITGVTDSRSFPVTANAYQTSARNGGPFITKLNPAGNGLVYSTFLSGISIVSTATDSGGNIYMTGSASVLNTTAGAFQNANPSSSSSTPPFIAKLDSTGAAMVYATYLGGSGYDTSNSIVVDASGSAYVTGTTNSIDFPAVNAYQPKLRGMQDAFVAKLNAAGSDLIYSTYLGGPEDEFGNAIAVNEAGEAFVAGQTYSSSFPVTAGVFQPYKGYPGYAVSNGFVLKLSASGNSLIYSSFLGGTFCSICWSAPYDNDAATAIAVDSAGYAYVGGLAKSPAFPAVDPIQNIVMEGGGSSRWPFVAKVTPLGDSLIYSTLMGDGVYGYPISKISVDGSGNAFAIGGFNEYVSSLLISQPFTAGALLTSGSTYLLKLSPGKYSSTVASSANPATSGQSITLTAKVLSAKAGGTVTFMDGASALGTVPVMDGIAVLGVNLPAGVHKITAIYSLDAKVSLPLYQTVNSQ
jgi:hypothetical protein